MNTLFEIHLKEKITHILNEFNQIYILIYFEFSIYKQFNDFIWTTTILQFILLKNEQLIESDNLNNLIRLILDSTCCDQLYLFIKCFDLLKELYENSISQMDKEEGSLQTTKISSNEVISINQNEDMDIKIFNNNKTNRRMFELIDESKNKSTIIKSLLSEFEDGIIVDFEHEYESLCSIDIYNPLTNEITDSKFHLPVPNVKQSEKSNLEIEFDRIKSTFNFISSDKSKRTTKRSYNLINQLQKLKNTFNLKVEPYTIPGAVIRNIDQLIKNFKNSFSSRKTKIKRKIKAKLQYTSKIKKLWMCLLRV